MIGIVDSGQKIITNGLILHLDTGQKRSYSGSGTAWNDLSGNGYNATIYNSPTYSTSNGGILTYDGLNDYADVASPSDRFAWTPSGAGLNNLTIDIWVRDNDTIGGNIISKPWNGSGVYNILLYAGQWRLTGDVQTLQNTSVWYTNTWMNWTFVGTPTQMSCYYNGALDAGPTNHNITGNTPSGGNENVNMFFMTQFGYGEGWGGNTSQAWGGDLPIVRFYNRALSATEILVNYNATRRRFGL